MCCSCIMATWRFGLQAPLIASNNKNTSYSSRQIFLSFHWLRAHHMTWKLLPTNALCNVLLRCNVVQLSLAANNILLLGKRNHAFGMHSACIQLWQIVDLLATDKSQYFAQPRPIIVNYYSFKIFPRF